MTLLAFAGLSSAADADCLFVEAATLNASWPHSSFDEIAPDDLTSIHRISSGTGIVAMLRTYTGKVGEQTDSEEFWKLTIELPAIKSGGTYNLPATARNTRFSKAGSAWVQSGFGYIGTQVTGTIFASRQDDETLSIDVLVDIDARFAGDPAETQHLTIHQLSKLKRVQFADLTPWLGLTTAGNGDFWATHRPKELSTSCNGS